MRLLKILSIEDNRKRYPTFPDHLRPATKYTDTTANGLTKCIVDWINFNGYQAERISSTGRYVDNREKYVNVLNQTVTIGSGKWIPGSTTKGTADISATIRGRSIKIEVKIGKDRQSEAQKKYQYDVERAGGIYIIAKNFEDFHTWYNNFISLNS